MLIGELIVYQLSRGLFVRLFTLSNINISATCRPNSTKLYLKHPFGSGLTAVGFGLGRIGTLVSMATDSSTLAPPFLIRSSSFFQVTRTTIKSGQITN